jgi:PRTRC genetic system protein A
MNDIDLGSATEDFDPFADDDELVDDNAVETAEEEPADNAEPKDEEPTPAPPPKQPKKAATSDNPENPLAAAIDAAETKDAGKAAQSLYEKLPVFEFSGAMEDISDSSVTFDELRIAKAVDFPELEDGKRVSWSVEYGKITKNITDAKGTSISKIKTEIETSKAFVDGLKKSKDKNPVCKVKPRVTAQSKGTAAASAYKGVFTNMNEVETAGKLISILPAKDGKVYEVRKNSLGRFITPVVGCEMLSDVRAGFTPASGIPRIPADLTMMIISFFQHLTRQCGDNEALVNVYWDSRDKKFIVDTPEQIVSKVSVHSTENPDYQSERFLHYMDIHSHNSMKAFFSATDNADEKATRLYTVIGRLDKYFPEIKTRISNGGKFHEIDPTEVFEFIEEQFPSEWKEKVSFRSAHKDKSNACDCAANQSADCTGDEESCPWRLKGNKCGGEL